MAKRDSEIFDRSGRSIRVEQVDVPDEVINADTLRDKADQAITLLENADANWASLTAAQKDAAMRLSVRVVAKLARMAVNRLEAN